jgi:triosephosphate isomerase
MLADLGCTIAEIGHSERRRDHHETDRLIGAKACAALRSNLTPLLCVGERAPGPAGRARGIIARQLDRSIGGLDAADLARVVVAYEPVWAIGEGAHAAEPEHVAAVHEGIRRWLDDRDAPGVRVLYGGSVSPRNAADLLAIPAVDGVFVGRSALDPAAFVAIATLPIPHPEARP